MGYCLCVFVVLQGGMVVADENVENLETVVVDDFDSEATLKGTEREWFWYVRGSKFVVQDALDWKLVEGYPDTLFTKKQAEGKGPAHFWYKGQL